FPSPQARGMARRADAWSGFRQTGPDFLRAAVISGPDAARESCVSPTDAPRRYLSAFAFLGARTMRGLTPRPVCSGGRWGAEKRLHPPASTASRPIVARPRGRPSVNGTVETICLPWEQIKNNQAPHRKFFLGHGPGRPIVTI